MLIFIIAFVEDDAIGGGTATRRDDGLIVLQLVDTVNYQPFADSKLAVGYYQRQ